MSVNDRTAGETERGRESVKEKATVEKYRTTNHIHNELSTRTTNQRRHQQQRQQQQKQRQ